MTDDGEKLLSQIDAPLIEKHRAQLNGLSQNELMTLIKLMTAISQSDRLHTLQDSLYLFNRQIFFNFSSKSFCLASTISTVHSFFSKTSTVKANVVTGRLKYFSFFG